MPIPLGILSVAGAGVAVGAFEHLETVTLGTVTETVTFSNLNTYSDYKHLQLRMNLRSTEATAVAISASIRFNGDTGNNYRYASIAGDSTVAIYTDLGSSRLILPSTAFGANATAGRYISSITDILDFSSTNKFKSNKTQVGSGSSNVALIGSVWRSTNAITSMAITCDGAGSFAIDSDFALYGIR